MNVEQSSVKSALLASLEVIRKEMMPRMKMTANLKTILPTATIKRKGPHRDCSGQSRNRQR